MSKDKRKRRELSQPPTPKITYDDILAYGLKFNRADLIMNRRGLLSDEQIAQQLKSQAQNYIVGLFIGGGLIFIIIFSIWFWLGRGVDYFNYVPNPIFNDEWNATQQQVNMRLGMLFTIPTIITMFMVFGIFYIGIRYIKNLSHDIHDAIVEYAVGPLTVSYIRNRPIIKIWDTKFRTDRNGASAFRHLDQYIIYYLPRTRIIISAEPVNI